MIFRLKFRLIRQNLRYFLLSNLSIIDCIFFFFFNIFFFVYPPFFISNFLFFFALLYFLFSFIFRSFFLSFFSLFFSFILCPSFLFNFLSFFFYPHHFLSFFLSFSIWFMKIEIYTWSFHGWWRHRLHCSIYLFRFSLSLYIFISTFLFYNNFFRSVFYFGCVNSHLFRFSFYLAGHPCCAVAKVLNYNLVMCLFELQLLYDVHCWVEQYHFCSTSTGMASVLNNKQSLKCH